MSRLSLASLSPICLSLALTVPACDFGRDNGVDSGRFTTIDAPLGGDDTSSSELDAPGLDAPGLDAPPSSDDTGSSTSDDAFGSADDAATAATDTGPDAPLVSMPCTAAGACDPFVADSCGTGMACRAGAMSGPTVCAMTAAAVLGIGESCVASNQCIGGSACLDFGDGQRCQQLCPMGSIGACGDSFVCTGSITGADPCIQVCRPLAARCDIVAQDCADPLDTCTLATNPETLERYTGCRRAGTRTDGQPCGGTSGSCSHGLVCISESGVAACHYACDAAADPTTCPAMQACTGTARSWGVNYCQPAM